MIKLLIDLTKEIFFPKFCYGCRKHNTYICSICLNKLIVDHDNYCPYCKKPNLLGLSCEKCKSNFKLKGIFSIFRYDGLGKILIKKIKYKLVREVFVDLFKNIPKSTILDLKKVAEIIPQATIIPVPLHKKRYQRRGFNQAEIFGKYLSSIINIPINYDLVYREINTQPQAQIIENKKRIANVKNAFTLNTSFDFKDKNFIIVDDVWTTGSTIKEIVKMLKSHKAGKIYSIVMAR